MSVWRFRVTLAVGLMLAAAPAAAQTFPVDDVSPLADNAQLMSTAVDANGNAMVLWSVLGPTGVQLAVAVLAVPYSRPARGVRPSTSSGLPQSVRSAIRASARHASDRRLPGHRTGDLRTSVQAGKRRRSTGILLATGTWGAFTALNPSTPNWPVIPSAVVDANGVVTVVWQQVCHGYNGCNGQTLLATRYSTTTGTWTAPQALEGGLYTATSNFYPIAGIDANGNVVVAFSKNNGADQTIYAKRYSANTATWGGTEVIAPSACNQCGDNHLAVDSSGNAMVTWTGKTDLVESVHFNAATGAWGACKPYRHPLRGSPTSRRMPTAISC